MTKWSGEIEREKEAKGKPEDNQRSTGQQGCPAVVNGPRTHSTAHFQFCFVQGNLPERKIAAAVNEWSAVCVCVCVCLTDLLPPDDFFSAENRRQQLLSLGWPDWPLESVLFSFLLASSSLCFTALFVCQYIGPASQPVSEVLLQLTACQPELFLLLTLLLRKWPRALGRSVELKVAATEK